MFSRQSAPMEYVSFFFSSRRRHTRLQGDWSSDVCSSDLRNLDRAKELVCTRVRAANEFLELLGSHERADSGEHVRSEEHTSELQSPCNLVCRLLLEKKKKKDTAA